MFVDKKRKKKEGNKGEKNKILIISLSKVFLLRHPS